ncbi:MAG: TetR/AcrR family transcriptional regulator [Deltaproteobacteria bacterium]|nr:TetR/AcrR family transcriptional regulator [Deltaproteobacteria bacterium]
MRSSRPETRNDILKRVIPLFAQKGYNGLTMREIASKTHITFGLIYHHFKSKQDLYVSAMKLAFSGRLKVFTESIQDECPPEKCLENLVVNFCRELNQDPVFTRLVQRELLNGDKKRLRMVVETVFADIFESLCGLCHRLCPTLDPFLLAESVVALCAFHYQFAPIRDLLPGSRPERDNDPLIIAHHICHLLENGITRKNPKGDKLK